MPATSVTLVGRLRTARLSASAARHFMQTRSFLYKHSHHTDSNGASSRKSATCSAAGPRGTRSVATGDPYFRQSGRIVSPVPGGVGQRRRECSQSPVRDGDEKRCDRRRGKSRVATRAEYRAAHAQPPAVPAVCRSRRLCGERSSSASGCSTAYASSLLNASGSTASSAGDVGTSCDTSQSRAPMRTRPTLTLRLCRPSANPRQATRETSRRKRRSIKALQTNWKRAQRHCHSQSTVQQVRQRSRLPWWRPKGKTRQQEVLRKRSPQRKIGAPFA